MRIPYKLVTILLVGAFIVHAIGVLGPWATFTLRPGQTSSPGAYHSPHLPRPLETERNM